MMEFRLRSKISNEELQSKVGRILTNEDYNLLLTRAARVLKPDGKPLAIYLPGALDPELLEQSYDVLHALKKFETDNRGLASGTQRVQSGTRTRSKLVASAIIGAKEAQAPYQYCRLTAFTAQENEKFASLFPMFRAVGALFEQHVPERYAAQMEYVRRTDPAWVIEGTPFSTVTVNNSYSTGVHLDAGDLEEGYSTLAVLRYGRYSGGVLVFPEYRVGVDMQHGDVLLMDAHEWHGNTALADLTPGCNWCGEPATEEFSAARTDTARIMEKQPACATHFEQMQTQANPIQVRAHQPIEAFERISTVLYYRTKTAQCGTAEEEAARAAAWAERSSAKSNLVDQMAREAVGAD